MPEQAPKPLMPLLQLPSGVALRLDKLLFIVRKELGQFMAVIEGAGLAPSLTTADIDVLKNLGVIQVPDSVPEAPKVAV